MCVCESVSMHEGLGGEHCGIGSLFPFLCRFQGWTQSLGDNYFGLLAYLPSPNIFLSCKTFWYFFNFDIITQLHHFLLSFPLPKATKLPPAHFHICGLFIKCVHTWTCVCTYVPQGTAKQVWGLEEPFSSLLLSGGLWGGDWTRPEASVWISWAILLGPHVLKSIFMNRLWVWSWGSNGWSPLQTETPYCLTDVYLFLIDDVSF